MGRARKEDRHARKKTKLGLSSNHIKHNIGTAGIAGKQSSNAGFVFDKTQFTSLVNKGKARKIHSQQVPQQVQPLHSNHTAENGSDLTAARIRQDIVGAAEKSNAEQLESSTSTVEEGSFDSLPSSFSSDLRLDPTLSGRRDSSLKAYMKELRKVVDNADVLLQVLDARDPLGCRSIETERMLLRAGKKIVLILNKIDLVPKSNVEAWLKYLRHDFPTLAFKASTQSQRNNLSQGASSIPATKTSSANQADTIQGGSEAIGAGALLQLIKNYSRNQQMKTSIAVGVFGPPNVGKSSIINSLKRSRVCSVASTPGHTKVVQSVMLDKSVRLLDCPGIVFSSLDNDAASAHLGLSQEEIRMRRQSALLRNVVKVELVEDPVTPVEAIMARVDAETLREVYGLDWYQDGDAQDFLMRIAIKKGRMNRGGKIDIESTARSVLHDWNVGRIKYFTTPPALHRSAVLSSDPRHSANSDGEVRPLTGKEALDSSSTETLEKSSKILTGFSEAFDLAGLLGEADAEIFGSGTGLSSKPMLDPPGPRFAKPEMEAAAVGEEAEEEIEDDHQPILVQESDADQSKRSTLGKRNRGASSDLEEDDQEGESDDEMLRSRNVPGLNDDDQEDDFLASEEAEQRSLTPQSKLEESAKSISSTTPWMDRLSHKAASQTALGKRNEELSLAFTPVELENMAIPTSAQRKKLKKMKKRAEKSGAGLVRDFTDSGVWNEFGGGTDDKDIEGHRAQVVADKGMVGMFGPIQVPKHKTEKLVERNITGSMFDVLAQGGDLDAEEELDDDQNAEEALRIEQNEKETLPNSVPISATATTSTDSDYEEEL